MTKCKQKALLGNEKKKKICQTEKHIFSENNIVKVCCQRRKNLPVVLLLISWKYWKKFYYKWHTFPSLKNLKLDIQKSQMKKCDETILPQSSLEQNFHEI